MNNNDKLVKALRDTEIYCLSCPQHVETPDDILCKWGGAERCLFTDAAAAIEELQQIADHHEQTAKDYWKEACEYKAQLPKLGEAQEGKC
jgi:hypothetical protein